MLTKKSKKSKQKIVAKDTADLASLIYDNPPPLSVELPLSDISPRDHNWDEHRNSTADVAQIYKQSKYRKYYDRMQECIHYLEFGISQDTVLKLKRS